MSIQAMAQVWKLPASMTTPSQRLVLLALADHADDDGVCWPGLKGLVQKTGLTMKTVRKHISGLVSKEIVVCTHRYRPDGSQTSNLYRLSLPGMKAPAVQTTADNGGQRPPVSTPSAPVSACQQGQVEASPPPQNYQGAPGKDYQGAPAQDYHPYEPSFEPSEEEEPPPSPPQGGASPKRKRKRKRPKWDTLKYAELLKADLLPESLRSDAFAKAWDLWVDHKQERGDKPYRPTGLKTQLGRLRNRAESHGMANVAESVELSIAQGWKGIFWADKGGKDKPAKPPVPKGRYREGRKAQWEDEKG